MEVTTVNCTKQQLSRKTLKEPKSANTTQENPPEIRHRRKEKQKWAIFTYHSPKIRKITNLFKHANIGIAFKSNNTIRQLTKPKTPTSTQTTIGVDYTNSLAKSRM
jgi:hypothetical protein